MFSRAMFVLDQCIAPDSAAAKQAWFDPLLYDAAYLNAVCLSVQGYFDRVTSRPRSRAVQRQTYISYAKAVRLLQERLACCDDGLELADSTFMTVLALYGQAYTSGTLEEADRHVDGLLNMVRLRGVDTFFHSAKLMIEIVRYVRHAEVAVLLTGLIGR